ncbi:hypothetical protein [Sphingomonas sp. Leaf257]|jgi:hypothetical protein|uniref:hypothetical protein n=1 Tax=Sphingomonas sp. Leaf257 TaxID=1736309 RepID=UPI000A98F762|nr:hypothetical protein [Sphingomonas sp. Leaf257]
MDRELQHPLANLLASVADEWLRYFGDTDAQVEEMHSIIADIAHDRVSLAPEEVEA